MTGLGRCALNPPIYQCSLNFWSFQRCPESIPTRQRWLEGPSSHMNGVIEFFLKGKKYSFLAKILLVVWRLFFTGFLSVNQVWDLSKDPQGPEGWYWGGTDAQHLFVDWYAMYRESLVDWRTIYGQNHTWHISLSQCPHDPLHEGPTCGEVM